MIKGLQPALAEGGKIKIGGLGEVRQVRNSDRTYRIPLKLDHFLVTKTTRDAQGDLEVNEELMAALPKDDDGHCREIPIVLHSDVIDEVFPTTYALYSGRRLACRGDGEAATRWEIDKEGNRTGNTKQIQCPCSFLGATKGLICKPHGTLHCSIALPDMAVAGAVHKWRTTSLISIQRMIGSLQQIQATCGTVRGLPLTLRVEPVQVTPPGQKASTVYCCHVELRAANLIAAQRQALQLAQMRRAVAGVDDGKTYRALIAAPAMNESPEEEAEVAAEFHPEGGDAGDEAAGPRPGVQSFGKPKSPRLVQEIPAGEVQQALEETAATQERHDEPEDAPPPPPAVAAPSPATRPAKPAAAPTAKTPPPAAAKPGAQKDLGW